MKKKICGLRLLLAMLMMIFTSITAVAQGTLEINGVFYQLNNGWSYSYTDDNGMWQYSDWYQYAAIVTYDPSIEPWNSSTDSYKGDMTIPDKVTYEGIDYPVVGIGSQAFRSCNSLTSIVLPASVKRIEGYAFSNCSKLTSITMPGVEVMDDYSIFEEDPITKLTLPNTIKYISQNAFRNNKFSSIDIEDGNTLFTSVDGVLYDKAISKIIAFPALKGGTYTIPSTITTVYAYTFPCGTTLDHLIIPATVTKIADNAFECFPDIKKLTIEDCNNELYFGKGDYSRGGVTDKNGTYHSMYTIFTSLEELYLGRNLKCPDYSSPFSSAYNLAKVGIGASVNTMPEYAFYECYGINYVNFNGTITDWCNISFPGSDATPMGRSMMDMYSGSAILYLKGSPLHGQVNIPEGATKIGAYAFYGQDGVTSVIVPTTVTSIEPYAFRNGSINAVYLRSNNVVSLADVNAFSTETAIILNDYDVMAKYKKDNLWSTLADNLHTEAFLSVTVDLVAMTNSPALLPALNALEKVNDEYRISILTNLKIRGTMNGWDILMIRNKMPKLRNLDLSEATILDNDGGHEYYTGYHTTANTISPYSFYKLTNLRQVALPQNITSIGEYAFAECSNLRQVLYMPETCTEIRSYAFSQSGLDSIVINKGVKNIGYSAFQSCNNLKKVTFSKGLETIESEAFSSCGSLKELVFPTTLKQIQSYAFYSCSSLENIDFAEGLENIGYNAFAYCYRLTDLHLPTTLKNIDSEAFRYCNGMTDVHLPSKLQQVGDYAFKDCGLKSVYAYTLSPVPINQNTFDYNGVALYAPDNSYFAYFLNTQWSQFQNVFEFPAKYTAWMTPRNTDVEINLKKPILNADPNNPADGELEPGSGMIFVGDGEQLVKKLILNWAHGDNYPSLIENGNLSVDELAFIMNVYPGRWYFFSFPFDVKLNGIKHDGKWVWRYYDPAARAVGDSGWKDVTTDVLEANVGYIFQCKSAGDLEIPVDNPDFMAKNLTRTRSESATGDKSVKLLTYEAANPQDASWNFIGNPNLSYYSLADMADAADFSAPITVWDPEQQTYTAVVPGDDDYDFHPFQAFFVQKPTDSEDMTFRAANRSTYSQALQKQKARAKARGTRTVNESRLFVQVEISDGKASDKTRVVFDDSKTAQYETGTDANKFFSMEAVPQVYTLDEQNVKYSINNRPNKTREVRLGVAVPADGVYTINMPLMDCKMALKDMATGTIHDFSKGGYTFQAEAGSHDNRFMLVAGSLTNISENGIEGIDITATSNGINVSGMTGQTVDIYNMNGVKKATLSASGNVSLAKGTYLVSMGDKTTKVLVK